MAYGQPYRPEPEDDGMGMGTALGLGGLAAGALTLTPWGGRAMRGAGEGIRSAMSNAGRYATQQGFPRVAGAMESVGSAAGRAGASIDDFGQALRSGPRAAGETVSRGAIGAEQSAVGGLKSLRDTVKEFGAGVATPVRAEMGASLIAKTESKLASGAKLTNPEKALSSLKATGVVPDLTKLGDTEAAHLLAKSFVDAKRAKEGSDKLTNALAAAQTHGARLGLKPEQVQKAFESFRLDDAATAFTTGQKAAIGAGAAGMAGGLYVGQDALYG